MSELAVPIPEGDAVAPPRRNGELAFASPWEGRAFGMCIAVLQAEGRTWDDFRPFLVERLAAAPDAGYYDCFAAALESFVDSLGLIDR